MTRRLIASLLALVLAAQALLVVPILAVANADPEAAQTVHHDCGGQVHDTEDQHSTPCPACPDSAHANGMCSMSGCSMHCAAPLDTLPADPFARAEHGHSSVMTVPTRFYFPPTPPPIG